MPVYIVGSCEKVFKFIKSVCRNSNKGEIRIFDAAISEEVKAFAKDQPNILLFQRKLQESDIREISLLIISFFNFLANFSLSNKICRAVAFAILIL